MYGQVDGHIILYLTLYPKFKLCNQTKDNFSIEINFIQFNSNSFYNIIY